MMQHNSILNGFGVPARYYFSPKGVAELGLYAGGIAIYEEQPNGGGLELESYELGFMAGAGYTFFGDYNDPRPGIYLRCHWNFFLD